MWRVGIIALLALGCGGGGAAEPELSCPAAPCGGDPVGTWTVADSCVDGDIEVTSCPELEVRAFEASQSGTLTVDADGTYAVDQEVTGSATLAFPASCFEGLIRSCSDLNAPGTVCTGDIAVECVCEQSLDQAVVESGDWSVAGDQITFTGGVEPVDFCVSGDTMSVGSSSDGVTAELILTR